MWYFFIFLGTFLEGEVCLLIFSYILIQKGASWFFIFLAGWVGSFAGDWFWFQLGNSRQAKFHEVSEQNQGRWKKRFREVLKGAQKSPQISLPVLRFQMFMRSWGYFQLGKAGLSRKNFFVWNAFACMLWSLVICMLAHYVFKIAIWFLGVWDQAINGL